LKQRAALILLLFSFVLEYIIRKAQRKQEVLDLLGTHQFLIYADVNLLHRNINTIKENTEALLALMKRFV
jgi:hypothetical protein